jgi:hypothetical protein
MNNDEKAMTRSERSLPKSLRNGDQGVSYSQREKGSLICVEPLKKLIECALISPYIKNEKPISLLIVAKAESGKTSTMKLYGQNKGIVYVTDCTAYGLTRDIFRKWFPEKLEP